MSGKMDAALLNSADKKIYLQCLTEQCTETTDTTCHLVCLHVYIYPTKKETHHHDVPIKFSF